MSKLWVDVEGPLLSVERDIGPDHDRLFLAIKGAAIRKIDATLLMISLRG